MFHNLVAKTLCTTKWERPDTHTAVAFLTKIVIEPNKDEWGKPFHPMKYIRGTRDLYLILSANGSGGLKWWIGASYEVHPNMWGHTGGGISTGRGFPILTSTKQKINTQSSTESDIVVVHDCMLDVYWTRYFMEAQGYQVM